MTERIKTLMVLATVAMVLGFDHRADAQSSFCLQYPVYYDGEDYLYYAYEFSECDDSGYMGDGYYWNSWLDSCPQSCDAGNCIDTQTNIVQTKLEVSRRGPDKQFPDVLPSSFMLGTVKGGAPIKVPPQNARINQPSKGINAQSQGIISVATESHGAIPVKLFVATLDFKAAGVSPEQLPKGKQFETVFIGIEVENDNNATPTAWLSGKMQASELSYSGRVDVVNSHTKQTHTYSILTRTKLN